MKDEIIFKCYEIKVDNYFNETIHEPYTIKMKKEAYESLVNKNEIHHSIINSLTKEFKIKDSVVVVVKDNIIFRTYYIGVPIEDFEKHIPRID